MSSAFKEAIVVSLPVDLCFKLTYELAALIKQIFSRKASLQSFTAPDDICKP